MNLFNQTETELEYIPIQEELDIISEVLKYVSCYAPIPDIRIMRHGLERQLQDVGALPQLVKDR